MTTGYDLAQTFYVDPAGCQNAPSVSVTGIDLYFFTKPAAGSETSGIYKPGVTLYMCGTNTDGSPNLNTVEKTSIARLEYDFIAVDPTGSTPTQFRFQRPVLLRTGLKAAFLIAFDGHDAGFQLWYNKSGGKQYNTTITSTAHSGKVDGHLFKITNGQSLTPDLDSDMTFKLYVAQYTTAPTTFKLRNRTYEILKVANTSGQFKGGEPVYGSKANSAGTVTISSATNVITGVGTTFTSLQVNDYFILTDGTLGNTDVRQALYIANNTWMTVTEKPTFSNTSGAFAKTVTGRVYYVSGITDHVVVQDATSNSSVFLSVGDTLCGVDSLATTTIANVENYPVSTVTPSFVIGTPPGTTVNTYVNFANSSLGFNTNNEVPVNSTRRTYLNKYPAAIISHTNEVLAATPIDSFKSTLVFTTTNPYVSPYVEQNNLDLIVESVDINNDSTNETENKGNAKARYISKIVNLAIDQTAEDLKTTVGMYKPANTDVRVYARFRNSADIETIDVKKWVELRSKNPSQFSSSINNYDFFEVDYDVPFEPYGTQANGTFTVLSGNTVVVGTSGAVNTSIIAGNVVRVYSPYFSNTYFVDTVTSSNTTSFTLATPIANSSVLGSGFLVDVVSNPNGGFLDVQKSNVLTYFNSSLAKFQGFDDFQLKVVLLSDSGFVYPRVSDLRSIAVSA